jgi:hypothetical protein
METDTDVPVQVFVELQTEPSDAAASIEVPVNAADAARSQENILQWMSYLPLDCVKTMIAMGWDVTT